MLRFALVLAFYIRFAGLTRGENDFVPPNSSCRGWILRSILFIPRKRPSPVPPLNSATRSPQPLTAYGMLPLYIWRGAPELADLFANVDLHAFDQGKLQICHVIRLLPTAISLATFVVCNHSWLAIS